MAERSALFNVVEIYILPTPMVVGQPPRIKADDGRGAEKNAGRARTARARPAASCYF